MKKGTPRHPKTDKLSKRLKVQLYSAVGILEMLWHFTAEFYPAGDVGRVSDEYLAGVVGWKRAPTLLVEALISEGWLDSVGGECRLIVHDWPTHAEDYVHFKLARQLLYFADGSAPRYGRFSGAERKKCDDFYIEQHARSMPGPCPVHGMDRAVDPAPRGKARQGKALNTSSTVEPPKEEKPEVSPAKATVAILSPFEAKLQTVASEIHERHPAVRRCPLSQVKRHLRAIAKRMPSTGQTEVLEIVNSNHAGWCESEQWQKDGGEFAKGLDNWLAPTKERWGEPPPEVPKVLSKSEKSLVEASRIFDIMQQQRGAKCN